MNTLFLLKKIMNHDFEPSLSDLNNLVHWVLRLGIAMEFIGHGYFGLVSKKEWLPFFQLFHLQESLALNLMPIIGIVDITLGLIILAHPRLSILLYMAFWGTFTALLRPLVGQGWWEFLERSYNYCLPFLFYLILKFSINLDRISLPWLKKIRIFLQWTIASFLIGHAGVSLMDPKEKILSLYYALYYFLNAQGHWSLPLSQFQLILMINIFQILLALLVLLKPFPLLLITIFLWKMALESLHFLAEVDGAFFEFIERGACYAAPLTLLLVNKIIQKRKKEPIKKLLKNKENSTKLNKFNESARKLKVIKGEHGE